MKAQVKFNHDLLRGKLKEARKELKLNNKYAAETCGIDQGRFRFLERGYSDVRERTTKFTIHEVLSICLAFDLDIWAFVVQEQAAQSEGTEAERRDQAWASAQLAWQIIAELKYLLAAAVKAPLSEAQMKRAMKLVGCP